MFGRTLIKTTRLQELEKKEQEWLFYRRRVLELEIVNEQLRAQIPAARAQTAAAQRPYIDRRNVIDEG